MKLCTEEERSAAWTCVAATIENCQTMQSKFQPGTSQHTLLVNRIRALTVAKNLLEDASISCPKEDLNQALVPICSIIHKSKKAVTHGKEGSASNQRLNRIIYAMELSRKLIERKLQESDTVL